MKLVRPLLALSVILLLDFSPAQGQWLKDQAVTYADFGYVHSVTSSMSHVYFATTKGVIRYNKLEERWEEPLTGVEGLDSREVIRVRVDRFDRDLYAETNMGVYKYERLFGRWQALIDREPVENDDLHNPSLDFLLPQFEANYMGEGRFVDRYSRGFTVVDAINDNSGYLWLGTWGFGAAVTRTATNLTDLLPFGLIQNQVGVICRDDSLLWLAGPAYNSHRTGLTAFNTESNRFFYIESGLQAAFPAEDINCLVTDETSLYVGTANGLYFIERGSWQVTAQLTRNRGLLDNNVLSLAQMGDSLFIGTADGLNLLNLVNDSIFSVYAGTFSNALIYDLEPLDRTVWIASSVGAYRYLLDSGELQRYQDPELVLFSSVSDIEHAGPETWFVSDNGAVRLDRTTGESEPFRESMDGGTYRALAVNEWVAAFTSLSGVTLVFLDREKPYTKEFSDRDGLASNTVYSLLLDGEYLWIGTDLGLTRFLWDNPNRTD